MKTLTMCLFVCVVADSGIGASVLAGDALKAEIQKMQALYTSENFKECGELAEKVLVKVQMSQGADSVLYGAVASWGGCAYRNFAEYEKAEPLLQRCLQNYEKHQHPDTAIARKNLAMLYERMGQNAKVESFRQTAEAIKEASPSKPAANTGSPAEDGFGFSQELSHTVGQGIPIILVHGCGSEQYPQCRWDTFLDQAKQNSNFAPFDIYVFKHDTKEPIGFNGYSGSAVQLKAAIDTYLPQKKIIFLAHSRGGLVCRSYMNYNGQGDNVLGLITLGTPHHGSPLAVPDWVANRFSRSDESNLIFNGLCNRGDDATFCTTCVGALNLAWDNEDNEIENLAPIDYQIDGQASHLTSEDANDVSRGTYDRTPFFTPTMKNDYGTLGVLNRNEKYAHKIVALGTFTSDVSGMINGNVFADRLLGADKLLDCVECAFQNGEKNAWFDHVKLRLVVHCLATMQNIFPEKSVNYFANDGLVPIQSALFLKIDSQVPFATLNARNEKIELNEDLLLKQRRVKSELCFPGDDQSDHLSLLDSTKLEYWDMLTQHIYEVAGLPMPSFNQNRESLRTMLANKREKQIEARELIRQQRQIAQKSISAQNSQQPYSAIASPSEIKRNFVAERQHKAPREAEEELQRNVERQRVAKQAGEERQRNATLERQRNAAYEAEVARQRYAERQRVAQQAEEERQRNATLERQRNAAYEAEVARQRYAERQRLEQQANAARQPRQRTEIVPQWQWVPRHKQYEWVPKTVPVR